MSIHVSAFNVIKYAILYDYVEQIQNIQNFN